MEQKTVELTSSDIGTMVAVLIAYLMIGGLVASIIMAVQNEDDEFSVFIISLAWPILVAGISLFGIVLALYKVISLPVWRVADSLRKRSRWG